MYAIIIFYNILWAIIYLITFPYVLFKRRSDRAEWKERFGDYGFDFSKGEKSIWIHGASVGEITAATRLALKIKEKFPHKRIVISSMTSSGRKRASETMNGLKDFVLLPFDFWPMVRKAMGRINPETLILVESELWPSLIFLAKKKGVKIILANARLSEKTYRRYKRLKALTGLLLRQIDIIFPREEEEESKFLELGIRKSKIRRVGSLKLDNSNPVAINRDVLSLSSKKFVFVAGSVRKGEEELIIKAFVLFKKDIESAFLIIAPRHLNRVEDIENILRNSHLKFKKRTKGISSPNFDVLILDTIGELRNIYSVADIAFVGGTLLSYGGHNLLEPAFFGVPILVGPFTENIKQSVRELVKLEGAQIVKDEFEITSVLKYLFKHPEKRKKMGRRARNYLKVNKGVVSRYIDVLLELGIIGKC